MRPPSKTEAEGYDIVVWVDKDGDIVARAFSKPGHSALRAFVNRYRPGDLVQIYCSPEEFEDELPQGIRAGALNSATGKIGPLTKSPRLQ